VVSWTVRSTREPILLQLTVALSFTNFGTEDSASKAAEDVLVMNIVEHWQTENVYDDDFIPAIFDLSRANSSVKTDIAR